MSGRKRFVRLFVLVWLTVQLTVPALGLVAAQLTDRARAYSWQMFSRTPLVIDE